MLLYTAYGAHTALTAPVRRTSSLTAEVVRHAPKSLKTKTLRRAGSLGAVVGGAHLTHTRPAWGIDHVRVGDQDVTVTEDVVVRGPFAALVHFRKEGVPAGPPVLLLAALSGHFSTMLRPTARTLLTDHDVYVTDWHNARDVPLSEGDFGLDEYISILLRFIKAVGPGSHLIAVCQPCPPALAAVALLAEANAPEQPRSLTLMSGPIDARVNPSKMNLFTERKSLRWFARNCIATVPHRYAGKGRRVYPGFLQVSAFMSLNMRRHLSAQRNMYRNLVEGDEAGAAAIKHFYDEYFAVLDVDEHFYLDTVRRVFKEHQIAKGTLHYEGQLVRPELITNTALMTVEAANDDMCSVGQTAAAHRLTPGLREDQRVRRIQAGAGHYGVFAGRRWENEVYPAVRDFIAAHAASPDA